MLYFFFLLRENAVLIIPEYIMLSLLKYLYKKNLIKIVNSMGAKTLSG